MSNCQGQQEGQQEGAREAGVPVVTAQAGLASGHGLPEPDEES